ncbi:TetR family transcriptional regulator [Streptococcus parasanguinis]|uniref:TetR/AcrR family transcriptional regulator n=1 Tax=Streptococcus parasanguinis TaxID=1318 RepID=UPI0012BCF67A|nr:TetR/AcrR family transcriptional regulator [Streptococcus parasanguinis]MTR54797.1 TetR family transcriptional regulator [Streptococcus parasanguinis]MTR56734.1 TetR family transcriptional regulator [Streptococcus parasanguinis]MTR61584.1 TetR family transcriptional regulator [Streptococcus parasanguinis]MTR71162.1 TetR family transcriptional regulator [Streptococcus parasanguinis]MTS03867.1 TetR family transcriptional regulator [Streptococcus parasanguinis]
MNQYQKTTEKKKQAIIQAALRLFKEKGFKETSIKSIAEVAEVSPVSIYNYFKSKDNLVALCVNDLFEEITQQAEDILKSNLAFNTKLDQALDLCQEKMSQQISYYFQDKTLRDPAFSSLLTKAITAKKRDIYRTYINLGKEEGLIARDLSTELILNVMDALNSVGNQLAHSDNLETDVKQIYQIFLYGILGKKKS